MDLKNLIFYIALLLFFIKFNPFLPSNLSVFSPFLTIASIVSAAYITIFTIYLLIKNLDLIKIYLNNIQGKITGFIGEQSNNQRYDLIKFLVLSIIIIFFIDIIFTKIGEQSFIEYLVKILPGIEEASKLLSYSPTDINFTNSTGLDNIKSMDIKFKNIQQVITFVIGPSLGAIILLLLRNLSYRSKSKKEDKNPGSRILFIFFIIMSITLIIDINNEISKTFSINIDQDDFIILSETDDKFFSYFFKFNDKDVVTDDSVYGLGEVLTFFIKLVINPFFFIFIISVWALDWYLFSKLW